MHAPARRSAFHDFMRAVFAERSVRARLLRANRASWLHRLSRRPSLTLKATNLYSRD
jgi:hypothetical protein